MRHATPLLLALAVAATSACGPDRLTKTELDLAEAVSEAVARGDTATLWLFTEVPFAYDRVYIAGPGTPVAQIAEAMRSDAFLPEMSRGIESNSHFHLLLFETRGKLVPATLLKSVADIDPALTGRMYGPEDGRFSVRLAAGSAAPTLTALPGALDLAGSAPE